MSALHRIVFLLFVVGPLEWHAVVAEDGSQALARAVQFLSREVPAWHSEHKCYSCHNNADAARALYKAASGGLAVTTDVAGTTRWLSSPGGWAHNGGDQEVSDQRLATIQFSFALLTAIETGRTGDRAALLEAAKLVRDHQAVDGSWPIGVGGAIGSPTTYGAALATSVARRVLMAADRQEFAGEIKRADSWLSRQRPRNVFGAAALLLAARDLRLSATEPQVAQSLTLIQSGASGDGGWGPYLNSPSEPFDTAMVLLALNAWQGKLADAELRMLISQGRQYLIRQQLDSGGWQETTRPRDGVSYAQHISTTAWATVALLETRR